MERTMDGAAPTIDSYQSSSSSTPTDETTKRLDQLIEKTVQALPFTTEPIVSVGPGRYRLAVHDDLHIDISRREDGKAVILSTIVYRIGERRGGPAQTLASNRHDGGRELYSFVEPLSTYSLMTRMMKLNTILNRQRGGSQIGMYSGKFILCRTLHLRHDKGGKGLKYAEDFQLVMCTLIANARDATREFRLRKKPHERYEEENRKDKSQRLPGSPSRRSTAPHAA